MKNYRHFVPVGPPPSAATRLKDLGAKNGSCKLSNATIRLNGLPIQHLIPIIQKYSNLSKKVFSGYYDDLEKTFTLANCPYTGIGAEKHALDQAAFNQDDLNAIVDLTKAFARRKITAKMGVLKSDTRPNEYRIVIGLQEGIHGKGILHTSDELTPLLSWIGTEAKPVTVKVIRPNQSVYEEPALLVSTWNTLRNISENKMLHVLKVTNQWNDHAIVEDVDVNEAFSIKFYQAKKRFVAQIGPGGKFLEVPLLEQLKEEDRMSHGDFSY